MSTERSRSTFASFLFVCLFTVLQPSVKMITIVSVASQARCLVFDFRDSGLFHFPQFHLITYNCVHCRSGKFHCKNISMVCVNQENKFKNKTRNIFSNG